jgi:ATP-dependent RNA helicase DeaD
MLCRKGGVTREDIGVIRIFDHETQFEVSSAVADEFFAGMRRPGGDNVRVERMGGEPERAPAKKFHKRGPPPPDRQPRHDGPPKHKGGAHKPPSPQGGKPGKKKFGKTKDRG